ETTRARNSSGNGPSTRTSTATCPRMWFTPYSGTPRARASALAAPTPTVSEPTRPGPAVTATASTSARSTPARSVAAARVGPKASRWARLATSGTIPPNRECSSIEEAVTSTSSSCPRVRAIPVSSQEVSMPSTNGEESDSGAIATSLRRTGRRAGGPRPAGIRIWRRQPGGHRAGVISGPLGEGARVEPSAHPDRLQGGDLVRSGHPGAAVDHHVGVRGHAEAGVPLPQLCGRAEPGGPVEVLAGGGADRTRDVPGAGVDRFLGTGVALGGAGIQQHPCLLGLPGRSGPRPTGPHPAGPYPAGLVGAGPRHVARTQLHGPRRHGHLPVLQDAADGAGDRAAGCGPHAGG